MDESVEALEWEMVDHSHAEMADAPPNGHASKQALKYVPILIAKIVHELTVDAGFEVVAVMCGQGLTQHTKLVDRTIKRGHETDYYKKMKKLGKTGGFRYPPREGVIVYRSTSTAASDMHGGPMVLPDDAAMRAREARRPDTWPAAEDHPD